LKSLDICYQQFIRKWSKLHTHEGHPRIKKENIYLFCSDECTLDSFYAVLFHSPYTRLTQKAFAWLSFVDYKRNLPADENRWKEMADYKEMTLEEILKMERVKTRNDKNRFTDRAMEASAKSAQQKLNRHLEFSRRIGNMLVILSEIIDDFITQIQGILLHCMLSS
jgi:3-hydroxy-3-methylglutaryl CoA synthase